MSIPSLGATISQLATRALGLSHPELAGCPLPGPRARQGHEAERDHQHGQEEQQLLNQSRRAEPSQSVVLLSFNYPNDSSSSVLPRATCPRFPGLSNCLSVNRNHQYLLHRVLQLISALLVATLRRVLGSISPK